MDRSLLSDGQWHTLRLAIDSATGAYSTSNLRESIEGILWRLRTGAPWRDLPLSFGPWQTVYNRFNRWSKNGVWSVLFEHVKALHEIDNEWNFMDGTYVKVHQHASGGIEPNTEKTIGKSRGGNTSKIHMLCDAHGNPLIFMLTAGNIHDVSMGGALISASSAENIVGDKGYDAEYLRDLAATKEVVAHIPRKSNSAKPNPLFDQNFYGIGIWSRTCSPGLSTLEPLPPDTISLPATFAPWWL